MECGVWSVECGVWSVECGDEAHDSGHSQEVYDLAWASTGVHLLSGSMDHTAIVWELVDGGSRGACLSAICPP